MKLHERALGGLAGSVPMAAVRAAGGFASLPVRSETMPTGSVGHDGESHYGDLLGDRDDNPELAGNQRYFAYDQMWLGDPICKGLLWSFKMPMTGAEKEIKPVSDDPLDQLVAHACRWQLGLAEQEGQLYGGLDHSFAHSLLALNYGSMSQELIWGDPTTWVDADGEEHVVQPIWRLGPRFPHTVEDYKAPARGVKAGIGGLKQEMVNRWIPGDKLLHHVLVPEGGVYTGVSMLRPAYTFWKLKKNVLVADAIGYDRWASGIPEIHYPGKENQARAHALGRSLRANERSYLAFEGPKPVGGERGWSFDLHTMGGQLSDPTSRIMLYNQEIIAGGLAEFLKIGTAQRGSSEFGDVLVDQFYLAVSAVGGLLCLDYTRQFLSRFVAHNFGPTVGVPGLVMKKIHREDVEAAARILTAGSLAGLDFTDLDTVNAIRRKGGLPEVDKVVKAEGTPPPLPRLEPGQAADPQAVDHVELVECRCGMVSLAQWDECNDLAFLCPDDPGDRTAWHGEPRVEPEA